MTTARVGLLALAVCVLGGCGSGPSSVSTTGESPALRAWAGFPVGRVPRPLVLVGPKVVDPRTGFPDGPTKLAYIERAVDLPATLPPGPATADGYPIVSAAEAARRFMSGPGKGPASGVRLVVTAIQLGTAEFDTDRGRQDLPAWQFSFQGVTDPAAVLAVASSRLFQPAVAATRGAMVTDARVGADGRTLTVGFVGLAAGSGPCTANYSVTAETSRTAVAVSVHAHDAGGSGTAALTCNLVGYHREATTVLDAALGARVLVDAASGSAVPVTG